MIWLERMMAMSEDRMMFKKLNVGRKQILFQLITEVFLGVILGSVCHQAITSVSIVDEADVNMPLLIIIFVCMLVFLWTPLWMPQGQVYDINDDNIKVIPQYHIITRWKIILYVLCKNDISPFIETMPLSSFTGGKFSVDRHAGSWAYSRYTYLLTLYQKDHEVKLAINPMDNGVLLPAGRGGFVFSGYKSREDICNIMKFFEIHQIKIDDPYYMIDALKNPDIVMYDYLESLHIKIRY